MRMKSYVMTFLFLLGAFTLQAQTERRIYTSAEQENMLGEEDRAQNRAERKRQQALCDSIAFDKAVKAIGQLEFVLEADWVTFKRGTKVYVSSITNFISVSDDHAVVQVSPVMSGGGPNGVGGITVEGRPSNIMLKTDKHGNVTFSMNVNGKGISAIIDISMAKGSSFVTATVNPNLNSARVTLTGSIATPEESVVFKGRTF